MHCSDVLGWAFFSVEDSFGLTLTNFFKLYFRDKPLYAEDLLLFNEATAMMLGGDYQLFVEKRILLVTAIWIGLTILLYLCASKEKTKNHLWMRGVAATTTLSVLLVWPTYMNQTVYNSTHVTWEGVGIYNPTELYISRGFLCPFLHHINSLSSVPLDGYQEKNVQDMAVITANGVYIIDGKVVSQLPEDRKTVMDDWHDMQYTG